MECEIKENNNIDDSVYTFFINLLYPYKMKRNPDKNTAEKSIMQIAELPKDTKVNISQPDWLHMNKPVVLLHNDIKSDNILDTEELKVVNDSFVTTENYETIVGYMAHKYIEHMITVRKLCTTYNTMTLIKENSNLWDIYKNHRF